LLNDPYLWKITGLIIAVAVVGKFFGSALAAKFVGQSWKDSLAIGALMNTRGLMELVVLNIGYDLGVLSTEIFTMMVIMALVTTFMTGPALDFLNFIFKDKPTAVPLEIGNKSKYKILFSFSTPEKGKKLLKIANSLVKKQTDSSIVAAMHCSLSTEIHSFDVKDHERKMLAPIMKESQLLNQEVLSVFKVSNDIDADIIETANQGEYDLLLVGLGRSIFDETLLGKILGFTTQMVNPDRLIDKFKGKEGLFENSPFDERTRHIIAKSKMPVGIFIDKDLEEIDQVFMPIFSKEDAFLIEYAKKLINNNGSQITVLDAIGEIKKTRDIEETIRSIEQIAPNHIMIMQDKIIRKEFLESQNLMIISLESWKYIIDTDTNWLVDVSSVLIIKP